MRSPFRNGGVDELGTDVGLTVNGPLTEVSSSAIMSRITRPSSPKRS